MGTRSTKKAKTQTKNSNIILWLVYLAIGLMVSYIAMRNFGFELLPSAGIGFGIVFVIVVVSEILDRTLGWTDRTPVEPLTAAEYIKANPELGHRAMVRGFVDQGGNADDIKAELAK